MSAHSPVQAEAAKDGVKQNTHPIHHHKHHVASSLHNPTNTEQTQSENPPIYPKGCKPLSHQVAGHRYGQGRLKLGMLQHVDGSILKPVQPYPRGECEVNFYSKVFDPDCKDPVLQTLQPFLPRYLGVCTPPKAGEDESSAAPYLKLEDACRRFMNPSILDVKIGRVSYDPNADAEKIAFESGKYPPQMKLGFQLLGMRISGQSPNEAIFLDKKWGRSLTEETIIDGLEKYFSGNKAWRKYLIKAFLQRLETILIWFESQSQMQFYSSSILFIYEGEFFDSSSDSDEEFIHKYRSYVPNNFGVNECFRAIDKVLQANMAQDWKKDVLQETTEAVSPSDSQQQMNNVNIPTTGTKSTEAKQQDETITSNTNKEEEHQTKESPQDPENQVNMPGNQENVLIRVSNGSESGYSSEVDSKKKASEGQTQQEFVNNLSRRMRQHSMVQCNKYRFPPDLVDVRMIDFTHIFEERKKDDNYIYGLRNLIAHLRDLLKRS